VFHEDARDRQDEHHKEDERHAEGELPMKELKLQFVSALPVIVAEAARSPQFPAAEPLSPSR